MDLKAKIDNLKCAISRKPDAPRVLLNRSTVEAMLSEIERLTTQRDNMVGAYLMAEQRAATHAAEPAPVAVDGSPSDRIGSWLSAALDDPKVCAEMKADINAWFAAGMPRADLAPTGSAALVEAAVNWWEGRVPRDDAEKKLCREIGKFISAALSQPADPQPTPEVEAERAAWMLERVVQHPDVRQLFGLNDKDIEAFKALAALARGSVAKKGER